MQIFIGGHRRVRRRSYVRLPDWVIAILEATRRHVRSVSHVEDFDEGLLPENIRTEYKCHVQPFSCA